MSKRAQRPKRGANHTGNVSERSDGKGFSISVTFPDGTRVHRTRKTREAAENIRTELLRQIEQGQVLTTDRQTLDQFLTAWVRDVKSITVSPVSLWMYESRCQIVSGHIGHHALGDLRPEHIQRLYADLSRAGYSPTTVHHLHAILRAGLKYAMKLRYIPVNPTDDVEAPGIARDELEILTVEQARHLLASTVGSRWHALWYVLLGSTMRVGEATALYWSDIDWETREIPIRRTVTVGQKEGRYIADRPKTNSSRRSAAITDGMKAALEAHRQILVDEGLPVIEQKALLFPSLHGAILASGVIRKALHADLTAAGLPLVRVHALRHTAATILAGRGVSLRTLQGILGHSQLSQTTQRYAHLTPAMHRDAVDLLDSLIAPKKVAGG